MRPVVRFALAAALVLGLRPALAQQSPGAATMPPGTQNPALAQPHLVPPPQLSPAPQPTAAQPGAAQPGQQPAQVQPPPQPGATQPVQVQLGSQPGAPQPGAPQPGANPNDTAAPSTLITPDNTGGLCECLVNHDPGLGTFDKTKMHQSCSPSPGACQAACNTEKFYSWVPHAIFSCPAQPGQPGGIVMNFTPAVRFLSRR